MEFIFPNHVEDFNKVQDNAELERLIREENLLLSSEIKYRLTLCKQRYLYARCKYKRCRALLSYKLTEGVFQLIKYNNQHNHLSDRPRNGHYARI